MFELNQKVKYVETKGGKNTVIHSGVIVRRTTSGAFIYRPRRHPSDTQSDVSPETCEWFPYQCKTGKIVEA